MDWDDDPAVASWRRGGGLRYLWVKIPLIRIRATPPASVWPPPGALGPKNLYPAGKGSVFVKWGPPSRVAYARFLEGGRGPPLILLKVGEPGKLLNQKLLSFCALWFWNFLVKAAFAFIPGGNPSQKSWVFKGKFWPLHNLAVTQQIQGKLVELREYVRAQYRQSSGAPQPAASYKERKSMSRAASDGYGLQMFPICLILSPSTNTNCENMAYRSFRSEKCSARGVRKVTTGITGLWQPSVHSDVAFWSFDVGSSYHCDAEVPKCWIVHPPIGNVSWV